MTVFPGGEVAFRYREGNPVEHFVFLVGKADVFKGNAVVFPGEGLLFLLQRRGVHQLFQRCDFVIDLALLVRLERYAKLVTIFKTDIEIRESPDTTKEVISGYFAFSMLLLQMVFHRIGKIAVRL